MYTAGKKLAQFELTSVIEYRKIVQLIFIDDSPPNSIQMTMLHIIEECLDGGQLTTD